MRRSVRIASVSTGVGVLAWAAGCALVYWRAFGHRRSNDGLATPADFGAPHEVLSVRTSDGLHLVGWYLPGTLPAAIVVSGGYRGRAGDVLGVSAALQRAGFHVAVYGWRGTPGSDVAAHTLGVQERNDLLAVIDAVARKLGNVPIGLLGFSMGGSVSISVGAGDLRVRAICVDSAFADPTAVLGDRVKSAFRIPSVVMVAPVVALHAWRTGARLSDFRPINAVGYISPRPILIIHGEDDQAVPVQHARRLYAAAHRPKKLWLLPRVGHVGAYFHDRTTYVRKVSEFFSAGLLPTASTFAKPRSSRMSS